MKRNYSFLIATVCIALLTISSLFSNALKVFSRVDSVQCSTPKVGNVIDGESVGAASTGTLFSGEKFRTFGGDLKLQEDIQTLKGNGKKEPGAGFPLLGKSCDQWAVVTTINEPTDSVKSVASLKDWCLVIVGDTKTADNYLELAGLANRKDVIFLSVTRQEEISNDFVKLIPFRSFARKNIGFLFAIRHGAKAIFDFDDDNVLLAQHHDDNAFMPPLGSSMDKSKSIMVRYLKPKDGATATATPNGRISHAFNPLPLMNASTEGTWPRGYPLEDIKDPAPTGALSEVAFGSLRMSSVGVIQAVCNGDPDVDAVYRLTRTLPFTFDSSPKALKLLVPMDAYAPYNAQATTHMYDAFWGLLLPHTVPGRVTDIWRSYFTQRIMHDLNLALVYAPPLVTHTRTPHNYIADMQAEQALYMQTTALLQFLVSWTDQSTVLPARIEKLNVALYERGFIELDDVYGMQEWLLALLDVGYKFPTMEGSKSSADLVVEQPVFRENQPLLGRPAYNVGQDNRTYPEFLAAKQGKSSEANWKEWLRGSNQRTKVTPAKRPAETVLKLIMMVKDEWPLLKQWVLYHGELLGFHNLYILDGSSDERSISF
jgi:hypothetical protein